MTNDLTKQEKEKFALAQKTLKDARNAYSKALRDFSSFQEFSEFRPEKLITSSRMINRVAYSDRMAWILAVISKLAYIGFENSVEEIARLELNLKGGGFELVKTFSKNGTQAFIAKNDTYAILAFRGTEPTKVEDWRSDIKAYKKSTSEGKVHAGFEEAYDEVALEIEQSLVANAWPLFITGHSLGGALATIATIRLEEKIGDLICACYTYGGPRVGNAEFRSKIKAPFYRVIHSTDIVTLVPTVGYKHAGHWDERFLSYGGNIYRGAPAFFIRAFEMFLAIIWPLYWPRWVSCHGIDNYRRKLEAYAAKRFAGDSTIEAPLR